MDYYRTYNTEQESKELGSKVWSEPVIHRKDII